MWPHIFQDLHARAHLTFVWVENVFLYLYLNVSIFNLFLQQKQEGNSQEKNLWTTFLTSVHVVFLNKMSFKKYFHRQFTEFIMSLLWVYYEFIMSLLCIYYEFIMSLFLRFSIIFSQTVDLPEADPPATPIINGELLGCASFIGEERNRHFESISFVRVINIFIVFAFFILWFVCIQ